MKKIIKNRALSTILGVMCIIAGILFAPIWYFWEKCPWKTWGNDIINILIAICILAYLFLFLVKKFKGNGRRVIKVLTIVEFTLLFLIALGCVFSQFKIINIQGACQIFGLVLWSRGCVELFRAYFYKADSAEVYPVWYLALSIAFVTFGTYCFAKPFIKDVVILWIFVIILLIGGIALIAISNYSNTTNVKTKKISAKAE